MTASHFRFPKSSRLHLRKEIGDLFTGGKSIQAYPLKAIYRIVPWQGVPVKMTVAVPKRYVRLAVNRNRIKRQIREAFRLNSEGVRKHFGTRQATLHLLVTHNSKESPDYSAISTKIIVILQRLLLVNENTAG